MIASIVISVLIVTILGLILPEGKMKPHIKKTFTLLLIVVIIEPIFNIKDIDINFEDALNLDSVEIQSNYLDFMNKLELVNIENNCKDLLENINISNAEIKLNYELNSNKILINKVNVNLINSVIKSDKEHIFIIEDIKNVLSEYLKIDKKLVLIDE